MDYIYTFRQAHKDRLEDAGIKPGKNQFVPVTASNTQPIQQRIRRHLMALIHAVVR